jgi:hypothetical protein
VVTAVLYSGRSSEMGRVAVVGGVASEFTVLGLGWGRGGLGALADKINSSSLRGCWVPGLCLG